MNHKAENQRHVLLVGAPRSGAHQIAPLLRRADFDVHSVEASQFVLDLIMGTAFELLIVGYPLPEIDIHELLGAIRDCGSGCRRAGVLLLARTGFLEAAQSLVTFGANRAVGENWAESRVWQAVGDLLSISPRADLRSMVYADIAGDDNTDRLLYRSVNVSSSGMLLKGLDHPSPGTRFDFSFRLPSEPRPVEGNAEIVRRADLKREGFRGIGARFTSIHEEGLYRLERYITYSRV
jgi:hypothetical protein